VTMRGLAVVCARAGSRGLPGKNLRRLGGETLVSRAVRQAVRSERFEAVCVSSDSTEILLEGAASGATVLVRRPARLASDQAGKLDAIRHALAAAEAERRETFDVVVDLDVTTPLRNSNDIADVVDHLVASGPDVGSVLTCMRARRSPYFNQVQMNEKGEVRLPCASSIVRRQDAPVVYDLTGAVYAWRRESLLACESVIGPGSTLWELPTARGWDIDDEVDWVIIQALHQSSLQENLPS
jgi:CMP-N,N'-diacetyllegionaminic acid synthase